MIRETVDNKTRTLGYDFIVERIRFEVTSPATGAVIAEPIPTFTGTATPGATVEIRSAGGSFLGYDYVRSDGSWSITWNIALFPGRYTGGVVRELVDGTERNRTTYDFTVVN